MIIDNIILTPIIKKQKVDDKIGNKTVRIIQVIQCV